MTIYSDDICALSASDMLRHLNAGELSSLQIVDAHIARIETWDHQVNSIVHRFFDQARSQAKDADALRAKKKNKVPLLLGMPMTIKESLATPGTPVSLGLEAWRNRIPKEQSVAARLLMEQGAIMVAKTNISQMLLFHESDNPIWGRTNNPWSSDRVPGGSSGGEAAAIAAGMSPWGVGTDIGGSIRIPCAFCGIAGIKPTVDRWSNIGSNSAIPGQEVIRSQCGPMARTSEDVALLLRAIDSRKHSPFDPSVAPLAIDDPSKVKLKKLRVGFYDDDGFITPSESVRRAVRQAVAALEDLGVEVVPFRPPHVEELLYSYLAALSADGGYYIEKALDGDPIIGQLKPLKAIVRLPQRIRKTAAAAMGILGETKVQKLLQNVRPKPVEELWQITNERTRIRRSTMNVWNEQGLDAVICPPHATPAIFHGQSSQFTLGGSYAIRYNYLNLPAGVVPVTRVQANEEVRGTVHDRLDKTAADAQKGSAGMPIGVQVAARPYREDVVLALMIAIEKSAREDALFPRTPVLPHG